MGDFSNGYIFGFAGAVCLVCSLAVASTSLALRDRQEINKERDLRSSILGALDLGDPDALEGEEIDRLWTERVELVVIDPNGDLVDPGDGDLDGDGDMDIDDCKVARIQAKTSGGKPQLLAVYVRNDDEGPGAYAIPLEGKGLWGPISGYLAIAPNGRKVLGATFFAPKETPGLGAEIMEPPFEGAWKGKRVAKDGMSAAIDVEKSCTENPDYCVDSVSGATITSRGVDAMVEEALTDLYDPYLAGLRGGQKGDKGKAKNKAKGGPRPVHRPTPMPKRKNNPFKRKGKL